MAKVITREGAQAAAPPSVYGLVKVCKEPGVILQVVGKKVYYEYETRAAEELEPEMPELAILYPVLSFNSLERVTLAFYTSLELGKLDDTETSDLRSWKRKLPDDGGNMFQHCAKLMRWNS